MEPSPRAPESGEAEPIDDWTLDPPEGVDDPSPNLADARPDLSTHRSRAFLSQPVRRTRLAAREVWQVATRPPVLLLLTAIGAYDVYWSQLTIARFYGLHAGILDLGSFSQLAWEITHGPFTGAHYWNTISTSGLSFAFAPVVLLGSYPLLLVIQTVALSLTAVPLYYLGARVVGNPYAGLAVALAFLISFAVAGVNWFDLHYEAFFIPLFVGGYALTVSGWNRTGYTLLALSGLANFPFMIFPALFGLQNLVYSRWHRYTALPSAWKPAPRAYDLLLVGIAVAALLSSYVELTTIGPNLGSFLHSSGGGAPAIGSETRLVTLIFLLAPLAFLPLLSPRWVLYLAPWCYVVLTSPTSFYQYPALFFTQYPSTILPFLFLGTIDAIAFLSYTVRQRSGRTSASGTSSPLRRTFARRLLRRTPTVLATGVVVLSLIFGAYLLPYGPFNSEAPLPYNVSNYDPPNQTLYQTLQTLVGLIPASDGNLLVQNSVTLAYPRPPGNNNTILITGNTLAYNYTYSYNGRWAPAQIDYVIADSNSYTFTSAGRFPYNLSMAEAVTQLYQSREYGMLGEARGMFVLEKNYHGPMKYFVPQNETIVPSQLHVTSGQYRNASLITAVNATSQGTVWFGPYTFIQPGLFNITYQLETSNRSLGNYLALDVLVNSSTTKLGTERLNGTAFPQVDRWLNVTQTVYVGDYYTDLNLPANDVHWDGALSLAAIRVVQEGPPAVLYQAGMGPPFTQIYSILGELPARATVYAQPYLRALAGGLSVQFVSWSPGTGSAPTFLFFDVSSPTFESPSPTAPESPEQILNSALRLDEYGVAAEAAGLLLLEAGYTGSPAFYEGQQNYISPAELSVTSPSFQNGSLITAVNDLGQGTVWYGPYSFVQPGTFQLSYELETSNRSINNYLSLDALANSSSTVLGAFLVNGTSFPQTNMWYNLTVVVSIQSYFFDLNLPANDVHWGGSLSLAGIRLSQLTPWNLG
jgi:uncharacterized membrane protein